MNAANLLSGGRVVLVPVVVILMYTPGGHTGFLLAGIVFLIAALTDVVDGYVARRTNSASNLGVFLDLTADKLLVAAVLIVLVEFRQAPAWVVIVILSREFIVSGVRSVAAAVGQVIPAAPLGKAKTFVTNCALVWYLAVPALVPSPQWEWVQNLATPLLLLAALLTVVSGGFYVMRGAPALDLAARPTNAPKKTTPTVRTPAP